MGQPELAIPSPSEPDWAARLRRHGQLVDEQRRRDELAEAPMNDLFVVLPPEPCVERPADAELIEVIADFFGVSLETASLWLLRFASINPPE